MSKSQRDKGAAAEREVANLFKKYGFKARRGQVFNGEPDLIVEGYSKRYHFEVKRHERLAIPAWIAQAKAQSKLGQVPVVIFRQNRGEWYMLLPLEHVLETTQTRRQNEK